MSVVYQYSMANYDNLAIFMIRFQIAIAINFLNLMIKLPPEQG